MNTRAPIRIAQVATTAMSIRYLLMDHIERLTAEGFEVDAICAADDSLPVVERRGIRVVKVPFVREPSPVADLRTLRVLRRLFRERGYHVVHSHTPKAGLLAPLAARAAGTPVVLHTVHGLLFHDRSRWKEKVLGAACEYWTAGFAHRLLSQSREDIEVAKRVRLKSGALIDYIGNGIDLTRFDFKKNEVGARARVRAELKIPEDAIVVGMVGRLVREKGFLEFASALRQLMAERPLVYALLVGPIEKEQSDGLDPRALVSELDPARTSWLGHRDDLPELYTAMDVFALPSYREGVPRTLMEASAMGVAVVASNIRGCREVVQDGVTGLLCEPREVPALHDAILRLVDDSELRARFGRAGAARIAAQFDANQVLDRLANYYRRTLESARLEVRS